MREKAHCIKGESDYEKITQTIINGAISFPLGSGF
jgi:hypothetical protein